MASKAKHPFVAVPDEIAESEQQNGHSRKLNDVFEAAVVVSHKVWKHGRKRQWGKALREGHQRDRAQC